MLKQNLSQRQSQKLSPQQIQLMKLLQVPTASLEQRIKEEMEGNPALEEGEEDETQDEFAGGETTEEKKEETTEAEETPEDDNTLEDYLSDYLDDDTANYKLKGDSYSSSEDDEKTIPVAVENSFHEYLEQQLGMVKLADERTRNIALQVVGSIDDDGYLRREPESIVDDLAFSMNITATEDEVLQVLEIIQGFDPAGIGARDLRESLLLQLERKLGLEEEDQDDISLAHKIIDKHFNEFSKKHYEKLQKSLSINEEKLKEAVEVIVKLNPKPASGYASGTRQTQYIVPDFIIENRDGELELTLNTRNAPDLKISNHYRSMLQDYSAGKEKKTKKEKEAIMFIKQKIDSAKWFIDAIIQRQQTMYKSMYSILQYQYDFFLTGDQKVLRPMILKDIAEITGLDISTISRVANSKYVQTEFGTMRLKSFFSESLQTESGEEVSTLEVKKILTEMIENEDKKKPFSDEKLKNHLKERGYNIARRTVAKYREQLNIPVARLRKEL